MSREIIFVEGGIYHIYNRGVDKRTIFQDNGDYYRFLKLMYLCNGSSPFTIRSFSIHSVNRESSPGDVFSADRGDTLVEIFAYCLMPNHFHILIKEKTPGGIPKFMHKLSMGYSKFFNIKYERTGNLFEGKFKAVYVDNDRYFKYLYSYIHLNPIKIIDPPWKEEGIKDLSSSRKFLNNYKFSSYQDYVFPTIRDLTPIIDKRSSVEYFEEGGDFQHMVDFWLEYNKE